MEKCPVTEEIEGRYDMGKALLLKEHISTY